MMFKTDKGTLWPTDSGEWCISREDVWSPGAYDSKESAIKALDYDDDVLQSLQDKANERAGGRGGVIVCTDFDEVVNP